jgi:hypothetical protein
MGQESLTRFDQPKKEKKQTKSAVENRPLANKIIANNKTSKYHPSGKRKEACNNKKTIITKNELKNSIFHFDCGTLFV